MTSHGSSRTVNPDLHFQELNEKMNIIINYFSDAVKRNVKNETGELWYLLKKTQSKVDSIANEIQRVDTENNHQDCGFANYFKRLFCLYFGSLCKIKNWKSL